MKNKFSAIIIILLIFNTGVSFYSLASKGSSDNSQVSQVGQSKVDSQEIPLEVQEIRKRNEQLKQEKPYLFMGPEELSKYDCTSITDSNDKKQCSNTQENYKVSLLFKDLKPEQMASFDCSKIRETGLIEKCDQYIKTMKAMKNISR